MADQWLFKSETYDNCNCAMNCGCQFNLPSTHGYCQSAFVGNIVEGHFNDTPIAGLNWAGLYKWPGEIKVAVNVSGEQLLEPGAYAAASAGAARRFTERFSAVSQAPRLRRLYDTTLARSTRP